MPRFPTTSLRDLFLWKESDLAPQTHDSEVVRFFVMYLYRRWAVMFANWKDYPRYPPEMVLPGYPAHLEDQLLRAACPGDHDRWAGALVGLYFASQNDRLRRELDIAKMTASLADLNQKLKQRSGLLWVCYLNSGIPASPENGAEYKKLLLDPNWRSLTAAKQASGTWRNPSWEMFHHWVKLVACGGYQPLELRLRAGTGPGGAGPLEEWRDGRRPPPFIDPEDIMVDPPPPTVVQVVDKNVYEVYNTLRSQNPKLDLSGYADVTPDRWESYSGWAIDPIKPEIFDILKALPPASGQSSSPLRLPWLE